MHRDKQFARGNKLRKQVLKRPREREFETLAENSPDIVARFDRALRHTYINPAIEPVTGMKREAFIGKTNRDIGMPEETINLWDDEVNRVFETGAPRRFDFTFTDPNGKTHTYESRLVPERGPNGEVRTVLSIARDVTEHVTLERALRERERLFRELTEHIEEVFWLTDWPMNRVVYVSPAFERVWGRSTKEIHENPMLWVDAILEEERHKVEQAFMETVGSGGYDITFRIRRPDGTVRWIRDRGFTIRDDEGVVYRIAGVALDITDLKQAQQELQETVQELARAKEEADSANARLSRANEMLENISQEDALTGIGNRRYLERFVEREWRRERRHHQEVALIMADVDYFKAYNDRYGHSAGDVCLRRVAHALAGEVHRPTDTLARFGGEEFAIVLAETGLDGATRLAKRMRRAVESLGLPHEDSETSDSVTLSFGVAVADPGSDEFADLLAWADAALYRAKANGRNRVETAGRNGGEG